MEQLKEKEKKSKPTCKQQGGSLHLDQVIMMFSVCIDMILLFCTHPGQFILTILAYKPLLSVKPKLGRDLSTRNLPFKYFI